MPRAMCQGSTCFWTGQGCLFGIQNTGSCEASLSAPLLHENTTTGDPHWVNPRILTKEQRARLGDAGKARVAELEHEGAADGR